MLAHEWRAQYIVNGMLDFTIFDISFKALFILHNEFFTWFLSSLP